MNSLNNKKYKVGFTFYCLIILFVINNITLYLIKNSIYNNAINEEGNSVNIVKFKQKINTLYSDYFSYQKKAILILFIASNLLCILFIGTSYYLSRHDTKSYLLLFIFPIIECSIGLIVFYIASYEAGKQTSEYNKSLKMPPKVIPARTITQRVET
jgi:hypothetical protein